MEDYKKKFDEAMDKLDSYLSSVRKIWICSFLLYSIYWKDRINIEVTKMLSCFNFGNQCCPCSFLLSWTQICWVLFYDNIIIYSNLIVFVFPAYMSLMTIKDEDKGDHVQWLTYWIIYGISCVLESTELIVRKVPYFSFIRFVFLVLCFLPNIKVKIMLISLV